MAILPTYFSKNVGKFLDSIKNVQHQHGSIADSTNFDVL